MRHVIAAVRVAEEGLGALRGPLHWAVDFFRRPEAHGFFGIDEDFGAEAAADIGCDDPQLVLRRESDEGREDEPRHVRVLAGGVERERVGTGIVFADRRARLHRVGDQPVVDDVELRHVSCGGEGRVGRGLVAKMPVVDRVVGRDVMDLRLSGARGLRQIDHRGQFAIVDLDLLRCVFRLSQGVGDDDGDVVADVAHLALGERRVGAGLHRRAVLGMNHPAADEAADLVGRDVVAGEDGDDAGRLESG